MDYLTYEGENQDKIERFLLVVYSIYGAVMVTAFSEQGWNRWIDYLTVIVLFSCWMLHIGKVKNYAFRAKFSAVCVQLMIVVYAIYLEVPDRVFPVFMTIVVLFGLYGIADIIYVTVVSLIIIYGYHLLISGRMLTGNMSEIINTVMEFGNILLLQFVVYTWSKRNSEGSIRLLRAIEDLRAIENQKDDFLANVSHEIRTPINTICGMSEIVLREELSKGVRENVQDIQRAGRNLMSIVSDILDFSELQSGNMEPEEEAYNITSTINDVISMTLAKKNQKKIELLVDCDANIPGALLGDEKKLRRVMINLLDNAFKFTEEGCIRLKIRCRREAYGINLAIAVKDTGIGMDAESMEKLFTRFSQIDSARNRHEGGIGLGLAISQALVTQMGGAITVKSKPGRGTTVQFVVPQKILEETPIAAIENRDCVNGAVYINAEQFELPAVREEYMKMVFNMMEQLKVRCHICRNLAELQRRDRKEKFSHIFIGKTEYQEDKEYFDMLSAKTSVVVVLDYAEEDEVTNPNILKIYKPFYVLTLAAVMNGMYENEKEKQQTAQESFITRDTHVLVVDDNQMNIRVIKGILAGYKIEVTTAQSGKEALEKIVSEDYDFVFMDHMMPNMDGVETMKLIRHKVGAYFQKVPIIALTANTVAGTRRMLLREGFNDFLEKPVERSVLERVLKRNLPQEKLILKETGDMESTTQRQEENEALQQLCAAGLDVQKGMLYCNGMEQYVAVLWDYCREYKKSAASLQQLFEKSDWKNYTITVHGMKSAMRSIGAIELSDMAKELESAGREGRISFIMEHHARFFEMYDSLFGRLGGTEVLRYSKEQTVKEETAEAALSEAEKVPVLLEEEFEQQLNDMEEAMYSLDGDELLNIITRLQGCQYCGTKLKEPLMPVRRKVEMSDYISAVEMTRRIRKELAAEWRLVYERDNWTDNRNE